MLKVELSLCDDCKKIKEQPKKHEQIVAFNENIDKIVLELKHIDIMDEEKFTKDQFYEIARKLQINLRKPKSCITKKEIVNKINELFDIREQLIMGNNRMEEVNDTMINIIEKTNFEIKTKFLHSPAFFVLSEDDGKTFKFYFNEDHINDDLLNYKFCHPQMKLYCVGYLGELIFLEEALLERYKSKLKFDNETYICINFQHLLESIKLICKVCCLDLILEPPEKINKFNEEF